MRGRALEVVQVDPLAGDSEDAGHVAPLTLRGFASEAEPAELTNDDVLRSVDVNRRLTDPDRDAAIELALHRLVILRHEEVDLQRGSEMNDVERALVAYSVAGRFG